MIEYQGFLRVEWYQRALGPIPTLILVANCLAPLETPEFMRLTSTKESEFCEFATSINVDTGGEFIFAEASILTNRVFRHLPNLQCAYF